MEMMGKEGLAEGVEERRRREGGKRKGQRGKGGK